MARLLTDLMLGKLTTYLRMSGHDVVYADDVDAETDEETAAVVRESGRTLVTRDRELGSAVEKSVVLESKGVEEQVLEFREAGFDVGLDEPERCSLCNGLLERDDEAGPADVDEAWRCPSCGQAYWKGSHWDDVKARVGAAVGEDVEDQEDERGQR